MVSGGQPKQSENCNSTASQANAHPRGAALLPKVQAAIEHLGKIGAEPNGNAPLCPTHNKPMLPSKKGSGWYCPVKIADDDGTGKAVYCKQRVK